MRYILFSFIFICSISNAQQVAVSAGVSVSTLDCTKSLGPYWAFQVYKKPIIFSSAAISYESPIWKRFSVSAVGSFFLTGGKDMNQDTEYRRLSYNNYSIGIIPNFYLLNKQSKLYIGAGPRFDYGRVIPNDGTSGSVPSSYSKFGLSGCIGYNYHFEHFFLGVRANYYYKFTPLEYKEIYDIPPGASTPTYFHVISRDYTFDLQVVFGYRFGKKKATE